MESGSEKDKIQPKNPQDSYKTGDTTSPLSPIKKKALEIIK